MSPDVSLRLVLKPNGEREGRERHLIIVAVFVDCFEENRGPFNEPKALLFAQHTAPSFNVVGND